MDEEREVERNGLTLGESARYLAVSQSTLRRIIARGEIPAARVGGKRRGRLILLRKDLDEFLRRQQRAFDASRLRRASKRIE